MTGDGPRTIAHRGFAGAAPENTLAAFEAVADGAHPAEMVELDVVPCADGTPVVFHDARLGGDADDRGLTDGSGVVWETPREAVLSAKVLGTDETIPTLEAALATLPSDVGVNVELKNPGTFDVRPGEALDGDEVAARRECWDPFVRRVLGALDGSSHEVLVSSFHETALAALRDLAPDLAVAPLVGTSVEDGLAVAERYDCEAIHPSLDAVLDAPPRGGTASDADPSSDVTADTTTADTGTTDTTGTTSPDLLGVAEDRGYDVNVWTVDTWFEAERLATLGVDGLIADYPGLLAVTGGDPT